MKTFLVFWIVVNTVTQPIAFEEKVDPYNPSAEPTLHWVPLMDRVVEKRDTFYKSFTSRAAALEFYEKGESHPDVVKIGMELITWPVKVKVKEEPAWLQAPSDTLYIKKDNFNQPNVELINLMD